MPKVNVGTFEEQWKKAEDFEKKFNQVLLAAMVAYPDVRVTRVHDSILLEGDSKGCQAFLDLVLGADVDRPEVPDLDAFTPPKREKGYWKSPKFKFNKTS